MSNLETWNKVCRPPADRLKAIKGGRLSGMTDVNPQWRLQVMTEVFGQIGVGWYYEIKEFWTEPGANGELMAFAHIHLFTKVADGWSAPITGIGGSALVAKESGGLHANDEAYKMAVTDALSVAMKQLGVAADIYAGLWDGSKYKDAPKGGHSATDGAIESLSAERLAILESHKAAIVDYFNAGDVAQAHDIYQDIEDNEEKIALWAMLKDFSKIRTAIKKYHTDLILKTEGQI